MSKKEETTVKQAGNNVEIDSTEVAPLKIHCKPTYNFQSVEFDYEVYTEKDLDDMFNIYKEMIDNLVEIAPNQEPVKNTEPATEGQLAILKKYNIKHKPNVSKEEASKLIQKSMAKS